MSGYKTEHRRQPDRGTTDRAVIDAVFDEALYCHLGFVDDGLPYVIPTIHVRVDDTLVLHGSPASRMMRILKAGTEVCVTATLLDGLVLARSVFNHSMNYRSAMVFGRAHEITDPDLKLEAMRVFTDKILPGRWDEARRPTEKEFRGTLMAGLPIDAATAKARTGPPGDEPEDVTLPVWAGVIPYGLEPGTPVPAPDLPVGIDFPETLRAHLGIG
jgi:nitroimidazol reductase NimA-like FMN-containing flavoprotein (pyridoxamine 5'-phosphate oxidase superfamily)